MSRPEHGIFYLSPIWITRIVKRRRILIALCVGCIPLYLDASHLLQPGLPYPGDGLSNLIPAWHLRHEIAAGNLPVYTELWYGGELSISNPLFKGFYPAWWPLLIPGVPMAEASKIILGLHLFAAGALAYLTWSREFPIYFALPIALILSLLAAHWGAHLEKLLGWPWVILGMWGLLPMVLRSRPRRAGFVVGIAGGMLLLVGNIYHAAYLAIAAAFIFGVTRSKKAIQIAAVSSLVSLPKLLSAVPILLSGADRPPASHFALPLELIRGLLGAWPTLEGIQWGANYTWFAAVGPGVFLLAAVGTLLIWSETDSWRRRWGVGTAMSGIFGGFLAGFPPLYWLPGLGILRTAGRASLLVAISALLLTAYVLIRLEETDFNTRPFEGSFLQDLDYSTILVVTVCLLLFSATVVAVPISNSEKSAVQPTTGREVASIIEESGCTPAWQEITTMDGSGSLYHKEIAYGLAEAGIPALATSYGRIGQQYRVRDDSGRVQPEVIIIESRIPNETVHLSGGWWRPERGSINGSNWEVSRTVKADASTIYLYTIEGNETCLETGSA